MMNTRSMALVRATRDRRHAESATVPDGVRRHVKALSASLAWVSNVACITAMTLEPHRGQPDACSPGPSIACLQPVQARWQTRRQSLTPEHTPPLPLVPTRLQSTSFSRQVWPQQRPSISYIAIHQRGTRTESLRRCASTYSASHHCTPLLVCHSTILVVTTPPPSHHTDYGPVSLLYMYLLSSSL